MTEEEFKYYALRMISTIQLDLDNLEAIAKSAGETGSSSITFQSTRNPTDEGHFKVPDISRCTIPLAMLCFATLDVFGFWAGKGTDGDFASTSTSFFSIISKRDDLKKLDTSTQLQDFYRHSIMHSFFPSPGYSVAYLDYDIDVLFPNYDEPLKLLNVRYLVKVVRIGLSLFEEILQDETNPLFTDSYEGFKKWLLKQ